MKKGTFIVIDGMEGVGKTSQIRLLRKKLKRAVYTFDPGGTKTGQDIRKMVLHGRKLTPLANFFLFLASRAALVEEVVAPALARGKTVISDRFDSSTYAYQGYAGKHPEYRALLKSFSSDVLKRSKPDAYIILDCEPKLARTRVFNDTKKTLNAYDRKPLSYYRRIRAGFKAFKPQGSKVYYVDAGRSMAEVHKDVWQLVKRIAG